MTDIYAEITKINPDRREVFGWASITEMKGEPVFDLQGDYIETSELEKAAYDYVLDSRVGGEMHQRMKKSAPKQVGTLIESFVVTPEKVEKMGLPEGALPSGWWIGFKVNDDSVWKSVKDQKYTGFSIHGKGVRKQIMKTDIREELLRKAFESASSKIEFTKNIAEITDVLIEREHPEAYYFAEVTKHLVQSQIQKSVTLQEHNSEKSTEGMRSLSKREYETLSKYLSSPMNKHLIGNHNQKDHDPKKKGQHSRSSHSNKSRAGAGAGLLAAGGLAAAVASRGKIRGQIATRRFARDTQSLLDDLNLGPNRKPPSWEDLASGPDPIAGLRTRARDLR